MPRVAVTASSRWPRIYRPPRLRGGHVILDLCMPDSQAGQGRGAARSSENPQLERHVSMGLGLRLYPLRHLNSAAEESKTLL